MSKKFTIKTTIIILTLAFVLGGCSLISVRKTPSEPPIQPPAGNAGGQNNGVSDSISDQLAAQTKIKKFKNYEELREFLEERAVGSYDNPMIKRESVLDEMSNMAAPVSDSLLWGGVESKEQESIGSDDYSKTNIQVEGVDEADIIKTDGKYIYAVSGNNLFIVDAYPALSAEVLAKIEFKSRPQDLFINGDYLVVFGQDYNINNTEIWRNLSRRSSYTFFKVFNIKDRKNPKQVRDLDFEGNYSNSRMIGDYVYFVTSHRSYGFNEERPLPIIIQGGETVLNKCGATEKCAMPPVYYFDIPYDNYNFTTITAINVKKASENINREVYVLSGNQNMYVSQSNIYITYTKYISEYQLMMEVMKELIYPRLSAKDQERIHRIEAVDSYILSRAEKMQKVSVILERYSTTLTKDEEKKLQEEIETAMKKKYQDIAKELEKTVIHKIAINKGKLEYKVFGEVAGKALNQFSMDERGGYFRIATTKNRTWSRFAEDGRQESYNNLYVLDEDLKIVGTLEGLARGERIYSVRFMQGRAYMVTFRQTDPLFVIDLKDPKNPKVLGKLKIPGFSNYLHPYDENTLIGIGKETGESEWGGVITKGIKLSLFDVSDVANPKEIDKYELGGRGSDSIALSDHKAFLFSRDKNLLVIPVSIREAKDGSNYGKFTFGGAAVFKVDKTGFELKGKIDHSDGGKEGAVEPWHRYNYYNNTVKRSLYIDDVLYTFSSKYLKMNNIDDLELVKNLELKKEKSGSDDDFDIVN